jgi:acyl phosphate:glycerol-3-phosphate acyltransferase
MTPAAAIALGYIIGTVPVAWVAARIRAGVDLREVGSGNVGASNVWQTVSRALVVPVGLAQIAQGLGAVLIARALGEGEAVQVAAGLAALVAHNWNPWLRFRGGRGMGVAIGFLLALSPAALATFAIVSLAGVAMRAVPQSMGAGILLAPFAAAIAGDGAAVVAGCAALAALIALKRIAGNEAPDPEIPRPGVWCTRLLYDRDVRDREAWVTRGTGDTPGSAPGVGARGAGDGGIR